MSGLRATIWRPLIRRSRLEAFLRDQAIKLAAAGRGDAAFVMRQAMVVPVSTTTPMSLLVYCSIHPEYRPGVRPPTNSCEGCNVAWDNERAEIDYYYGG